MNGSETDDILYSIEFYRHRSLGSPIITIEIYQSDIRYSIKEITTRNFSFIPITNQPGH